LVGKPAAASVAEKDEVGVHFVACLLVDLGGRIA
jgi:hypothetical protein